MDKNNLANGQARPTCSACIHRYGRETFELVVDSALDDEPLALEALLVGHPARIGQAGALLRNDGLDECADRCVERPAGKPPWLKRDEELSEASSESSVSRIASVK